MRRLPALRITVAGVVTLFVVASAAVFVLAQLQPGLLVANTTPAGGDMGAHVWGPAYLRDHLLPSGRVAGWTPEWYAGFPAYHFYMVVPSLAIVALDAVLPYGVAFKLVTVSGLVTLPIAAWAFGRLARMPFPAPALLAVATVPFVFDRNFTIYGGNAASTLAGEFAFSISLSLAVLFLGLVARGLDTGRLRALAAVVLALCGLCHIIPAFFAAAGAVVWLVVAHAVPALWALLRSAPEGSPRRTWSLRGHAVWMLTTAVVAGLLSAFWVLPFVLRRGYLNDMGWEKRTEYLELLFPGRIGEQLTRWWDWLAERLTGEVTTTPVATVAKDLPQDLWWVLVLAVWGALLSLVFRRRAGIFLTVMAAGFGIAFVLAPQGRLWNARLLPFWYLCLYLLAAVALSEALRALGTLIWPERGDEPPPVVSSAAAVGALLAVLLVVGLPMHNLPFGSTQVDESGASSYRWLGLTVSDRSFVPDWARWNYSGYERKAAYPEYRDLVDAMAGVGDRRGCGRAMWEYEPDLNRFGTPMALMLLPYWTDGCIGSMEGLYFEASATTPYHFLNQSELSAQPSRAQRDLPYGELDLQTGVQHLQLLGVRYYMAFSQQAVSQADAHPDLEQVASSGSWRIYEVADSELVEPLEHEPAVLTGIDPVGRSWLAPAVDWYTDPLQWDVYLAASGPDEWQRVEVTRTGPAGGPTTAGTTIGADVRLGDRRLQRLPAVEVSGIEEGQDRIEFDVDRTGVPVLVKSSYFPNWRASGADGPYRVAPNLMLVVPTDEHVELHYGTTPVEWGSWLLTLLGIAGLVLLVRRPQVELDRPRPVEDDLAELDIEAELDAYMASLAPLVSTPPVEVTGAPLARDE